MKIILTKEVHDKIRYMVQESPVEISGLGAVHIDKGTARVIDVWCLDAYGSSAYTEFKDCEMALLNRLGNSYMHPLWFYWHSHVNMGVRPSGTDTDTVKDRAKRSGACFSVIFNKKGEMYGMYGQDGDMPTHFVEGIDVEVEEQIHVDEVFRKEFEEQQKRHKAQQEVASLPSIKESTYKWNNNYWVGPGLFDDDTQYDTHNYWRQERDVKTGVKNIHQIPTTASTHNRVPEDERKAIIRWFNQLSKKEKKEVNKNYREIYTWAKGPTSSDELVEFIYDFNLGREYWGKK